jgi:hypothetical protein
MAKKKRGAGGGVGGRPRVKIDDEDLLKLAKMQCTYEEAAAFFGCDERTIKRRLQEPKYRSIWDRGLATGKTSIRRLQWRHAAGTGSSAVQMTIHLSKHHLGQTDKAAIEHSGRIDSTVDMASAKERVSRKLDDLAKRIASRVDGIAVAAGAGKVSERSVGS